MQVAKDDFTELHLVKLVASAESECTVMPDAQAWLYYSAACKGIVNSHGLGRNVMQRAVRWLEWRRCEKGQKVLS